MAIYADITAALTDIAGRSFYECAAVFRNSDGTYTVDDDSGYPSELGWTYADGIQLPPGVIDNSRAHDAAEYYSSAAHIRYNLSAAVDALEDGARVTFAYAVLEDDDGRYSDDGQEWIDADGMPGDPVASWALIAYGDPAQVTA